MKDLIYIKENSLPTNFCEHVIEKFEESTEVMEGISGGGVNYNIKKSTDLMILDLIVGDNRDEDWSYIYDFLREDLLHNLVNYSRQHPYLPVSSKFGSELSLIRSASACYGATSNGLWHMQMQRYVDDEGYYAWHYENHGGSMAKREMAFMWYLNDVSEGGETEFRANGLKIKPKAGAIAIFPAFWTHLHRGNPPSKGQKKYIITGWIEHNKEMIDKVSMEFPNDYFM
tara:strand:+ start:3033 stop:3716 length:684 start_codon:yes stop_codon:yes gene_type:complete